MTWRCLKCTTVSDADDAEKCTICGWSRDLSKRRRLPPIAPGRATLPDQDGEPHAVQFFIDRTARCLRQDCPTMYPAGCPAVQRYKKRLARRTVKTIVDLVLLKDRVYDVLARHQDARNSDNRLYLHYFEDYHGVPPGAPWGGVLDLVMREYESNVFAVLERRRQEWQNDMKVFPPDPAVAAERAANEAVHHDEYAKPRPRETV